MKELAKLQELFKGKVDSDELIKWLDEQVQKSSTWAEKCSFNKVKEKVKKLSNK